MERKIIGLFLIALIGGLGGGFGLTYVIYQPQIQNLQYMIANMKSMMWHEVYSVESSSDTVSGVFQIKGTSVRMSWYGVSDYSYGNLYIRLQFANGTGFASWGSSGVWNGHDNEYGPVEPGNYYLNISTLSTEYSITLYDYY